MTSMARRISFPEVKGMRRLFLFLGLMAACLLLCREPRTVAASAGVPDKKWILIEIDRKRLTLYRGTESLAVYPIATGGWDTPSPIGAFYVNKRFMTEMSGFGTRFLGLSVPWGQYGIHGTNRPESIGGNASHGCFRLRVKDAEALYAQVPGWTKVVIEGGPYGNLGDGLRTLRPGDRCSAVIEVQRRLAQQGFYFGSADGIYGAGMSRAVVAARKAHGLSDQDLVDAALYRRLGILLFE